MFILLFFHKGLQMLMKVKFQTYLLARILLNFQPEGCYIFFYHKFNRAQLSALLIIEQEGIVFSQQLKFEILVHTVTLNFQK